MSESGRPLLKLKFTKRPANPTPNPTPAPAPAPAPVPSAAPPETPSQPPSQPKLKLKIGRKPQPQLNEPGPDEKAKKKKSSTKKRAAENTIQPEVVPAQVPKRLKLNPSKKLVAQSLRIKNKSLIANRPVGVGYDSEASDTEADPSIEEQFILRMEPGEDCDILRQTIADRRFDKNEISIKPLTREGRRIILKIRDHTYAAALVDLPCIIEGMKSWDRRGWYKSADICQMLLVLGLPDDKTLQYPHGLAPPLHWVRKRRFRDRVSTRTIEQVEKAVEELIAQDEESLFPPRFELVDSTSLNRAEGLSGDYDEYYDEEQDAEGDYMEEDFDDALAAEMEAALAGDDDDPAASVAADEQQVGPMSESLPPPADTPRADSSGDESDESEEGAEELDEEQVEQQRQLQQQREEIEELEGLIRSETSAWEKVGNHILRAKMGKRIQELKKDLTLKKVSAGLGDDTDI
ncbi:hypothetical protein N7495_004814 [Penicillium taxi]|uniref:uncharacterized protein n=1 Tax=Penicillium taxi TaxID=168475 RepID=UPI0025455EBD|nr:uncharacterized protein N7495_004814 [Penicillium taxi]KAJ5900070.1 hypothetical protein N7495_004814 [Penicillium taxi]